jgi:1-deoxy-D-xylulose-5-phosphate reductoisomerase
MFNKAMELIETKEFLASSLTETIIHPEALIHALVGFNDGALMAHVGPHDAPCDWFCAELAEAQDLPVQRLRPRADRPVELSRNPAARYPVSLDCAKVMEAGGLTVRF